MKSIIQEILAPSGNLPTLYYGTTREQWTKDSNTPLYLRLTTKLNTAQRFASHAAVVEADQGSMAAEAVVIAFSPVSLKRLFKLGYALEADPAYLRDPYLGRAFPVEPVTARAWQYSLTAYHGVVISGFLHEHKRGLTVRSEHAAEEVESEETVPYPVLSTATTLAELRLDYDRAVTQLTLNAIHYRTSGITSLNLTDCINRVNSLRHAIDSLEAEQQALAVRIARGFSENSSESLLDDAVLKASDASASALNKEGLTAQVRFLLEQRYTPEDIVAAASVK